MMLTFDNVVFSFCQNGASEPLSFLLTQQGVNKCSLPVAPHDVNFSRDLLLQIKLLSGCLFPAFLNLFFAASNLQVVLEPVLFVCASPLLRGMELSVSVSEGGNLNELVKFRLFLIALM